MVAGPMGIAPYHTTQYLNRWWRIVGGISMNLATGMIYTWSVFVTPLEKQFGWKRQETSMVFTCAVVVLALSFAIGGRIQDKYGPFVCSLTGSLLLSFGLILCGRIMTPVSIFINFGLVAGAGCGLGYSTPIPVLAKWFPDKRGLAVGLVVGACGIGPAIFGPLAQLKLIPKYGLPTTFKVLGIIFLFLTMLGVLLLRNPPIDFQPVGSRLSRSPKHAPSPHQFGTREMLLTPTFYMMWMGYALGTSAGLMVVSQLVPFAHSVGIANAVVATLTLVIGALGNGGGRVLSGWLSDQIGRVNVLRGTITISVIAMAFLARAGGSPASLYAAVFAVYWCYGTQLSVNGSATADFWGTDNAGANYGLMFSAWGIAGIIGPEIGGRLYDKYHTYNEAFYVAALLSAFALLCELLARRPKLPFQPLDRNTRP